MGYIYDVHLINTDISRIVLMLYSLCTLGFESCSQFTSAGAGTEWTWERVRTLLSTLLSGHFPHPAMIRWLSVLEIYQAVYSTVFFSKVVIPI